MKITMTVCILAYDPKKKFFLIIQDKEKHKKGFVTGGVEKNEKPEDAAVREFMEEVGIKIKIPPPSDIIFEKETISKRSQDLGNKHIFRMYKVELEEQPVQLGCELKSAKWISRKELEEMYMYGELLFNHAQGFKKFSNTNQE